VTCLVPIFRTVACALAACALAFDAGAAGTQDYPTKPIRIVTGPSGSGSDIVARLLAQSMSPRLGQQAIVDNRAGIIAVETAAKAPPDGYTLLVYGSVVWLEPLLRDHVAWDPVRDLSPITLAARSPNVLLVNPSLPVTSVNDLIALARAKPGELSYASAGSGTTAQLAAELFKSMAGGLNIVHVPYKGAGPAMTDLMSGQVHLSFVVAASAIPHMKSGKLKALAVTTAEPSALVPGLPTVAASGLPGYESVLTIGAFAPATISAGLIARLNQEMVRALNTPEVKEKLFNTGTEVVGSSPQMLLAAGQSDMARWGKVIRDAGIRSH
jgi:tripartite-type tricarboxylate transporter receptor subunit TctC